MGTLLPEERGKGRLEQTRVLGLAWCRGNEDKMGYWSMEVSTYVGPAL